MQDDWLQFREKHTVFIFLLSYYQESIPIKERLHRHFFSICRAGFFFKKNIHSKKNNFFSPKLKDDAVNWSDQCRGRFYSEATNKMAMYTFHTISTVKYDDSLSSSAY